jgi:hypothetical protein
MSPRGRAQTRGVEPATEGPGGGPAAPGLADAEGDSDQFRTPGGVLATLSQGRLTDLRGVGVRQARGRAVVGANRVFAAVVESLQQVADGTCGQAEPGRETGWGLSLLSPLK